MTAYNATPTADLVDLILAARNRSRPPQAHPVTVALWEPVSFGDPTTAVATMSAALYVRLYPHGHHGPTIVDQVSP